MICYRHADPRFPFLVESAAQPPARWHGKGEGPVQYLSDTPNGAWAEFLRHEEIIEAEDLETVRRAMWAVEVSVENLPEAGLPTETLTGGPGSHAACREEAKRIRATGAPGLAATSAALLPGRARGWRVDGGLQPGPDSDGRTIVLFGRRPDLLGWAATGAGQPRDDLLGAVRHLR
jgi:RES domain